MKRFTAGRADGDADDRVIRLVDGTTGVLVPIVDDQMAPHTPQAAEEFVLGTSLVAFRTSEVAQGNTDFNADGDVDDHVLQVYDLASGERINTGQAVTPCRLVACDPRRPYRVSQQTVRFLTLESQQHEDLNDDGDLEDLLVQVFNAAARTTEAVAEVADSAAGSQDPSVASDPLAAPAPGGESGGVQVLVREGRCVEDTLAACIIGMGGCASAGFCFGDPGPAGTCVRDTGRTCLPDKSSGDQGCLVGASCVTDLAVLGVADEDLDEVPDALDNCPAKSNVNQADADLDGVGDVCDLETCGNSLIELDELCDDGNLVNGDGCDDNCRTTACGNGVVTAGEGCDDGNCSTSTAARRCACARSAATGSTTTETATSTSRSTRAAPTPTSPASLRAATTTSTTTATAPSTGTAARAAARPTASATAIRTRSARSRAAGSASSWRCSWPA